MTDAVPLWLQIMRRDAKARREAYEAAHAPYVPPVVLPPLTPARAPVGPAELAAGQGRQALGLGRKAARAGWQVQASYWEAADGVEGCAVRLARGQLRAVATWLRQPGETWSADVAYAWRAGAMPTKVGHMRLLELLPYDDMGETEDVQTPVQVA